MMRPWQDILAVSFNDVADDEYGQHSHAVVSLFKVAQETEWFRHVGSPVAAEYATRIDPVSSWSAAIEPLLLEHNRDDDAAYGPNGQLVAPVEKCWRVIRSAKYNAIWTKARKELAFYNTANGGIPQSLPTNQQSFIEEYVYEFYSFVLAEILAPDEVGSTYFREQLEWYADGHFPCGWAGDWPLGRMRVY